MCFGEGDIKVESRKVIMKKEKERLNEKGRGWGREWIYVGLFGEREEIGKVR